MNESSDVIVVGAGIFGVTAALELRRREFSVSLLDPGPLPHPDAASTDISKVVRMDYGPDDFYMDLMAGAFAGWQVWNELWPRPLYHQTGMVFLSSNELAPGGFEYESYVRLQRRGVPVEKLDPSGVRRRFPAWDSPVDLYGYFNPRAGWAESGEVVARLISHAKSEGVHLYEGEAFSGLLERGERTTGVFTRAGNRFLGDWVILALGSWTGVLFPEISQATRPAMWPVGQPVVHFRTGDLSSYQPPEFPVWAMDIHTSGWYGFPATREGILKVADHGPGWRFDPRGPRLVPASEEDRFRGFLGKFLPGLAGAPVDRTRLCFYCDTFDGDFWIDHHPARPGLLICAGGSGHAFKFAPLLGPVIADVLERKPNRFASRFAWRQPQAGQKPPARK